MVLSNPGLPLSQFLKSSKESNGCCLLQMEVLWMADVNPQNIRELCSQDVGIAVLSQHPKQVPVIKCWLRSIHLITAAISLSTQEIKICKDSKLLTKLSDFKLMKLMAMPQLQWHRSQLRRRAGETLPQKQLWSRGYQCSSPHITALMPMHSWQSFSLGLCATSSYDVWQQTLRKKLNPLNLLIILL